MTETPWLTKTQAARYLQVSERTLDRYVNDARLPVYRIKDDNAPRFVRFRREDLDALIEVSSPKAPNPDDPVHQVFEAEYATWKGMCSRVLNRNDMNYRNYGGRGIDMDPRWRKFDMFLADVGPKPHPELSIDRIDNDKGYWPDNVRWATSVQQIANQRKGQGNMAAHRTISSP